MKFSYKFNNLLGTVYREGDLLFSSDGSKVVSPVGNRITVFDLKNNKSYTLPVESRYNYTALDLSPNGCILLAINQTGEAHMISLVSQSIIHRYHFKQKVAAVKFSPDSKHFAVLKSNNVFIFKAPGPFSGDYNAFVMERVYRGAFDETTCVDWSFDSKVIAVGSNDMTTKLYPIQKVANFKTCSLSSHTDIIVACFFEARSLDITTLSRNGLTCVWECSVEAEDLTPYEPTARKVIKRDDPIEEDDITDVILERTIDDMAQMRMQSETSPDDDKDSDVKQEKLFYKRVAKHYLADEVRKEDRAAVLTAAAYHKDTKILVTGYSNGAFVIHEMPSANLIHSLSISKQSISSIAMNNNGDWIALGCGGIGQLLVWEWQSETYVMKQQGHSANMSCVAYSGDGHLLATGGEDGKVKLWSISAGHCIITWSEHTNPVTALAFSNAKRFVVSSSLDGTVRAFDVLRYRNFRTFTTPRPVQLVSVAVDSSGEFVAAGGQDVFEIFLWSVKLSRLLDVLSGHEGPVYGIAFSPALKNATTLASVSWDKTLRIWQALDSSAQHESIELTADGLCVAFRPDGDAVVVSTLNGQLSVYDVQRAAQLTSIDGRNDLGSGRTDTDLVTAKQSLKAKSFTSVCYSADGEVIIAGGQSKNVCIYDSTGGIIIKRFEITQNRSFDAVDDFVNRRKITEFGNVELVEEREELEGGNVALRLPGVRRGDKAARSHKPEVRIFCLEFSPTGQQWAAATTEGLLIYSQCAGLVFNPWELHETVTPRSIEQKLSEHDFANALIMAMQINETKLIYKALESVPPRDIELIVTDLSIVCVERLVTIISNAMDTSRHFEFYLNWSTNLMTIHGPALRAQKNGPILLALQKSLTTKYDQLSKLCDFNKYTIQYISQLGNDNARKDNLADALHSDDEMNGSEE